MEILLIVLVVVLLVVNVFVVYKLMHPKEVKTDTNESMLLMQRIEEMSRTVDAKLSETNKAMQEGSRIQFRESRELIQDINKEMNEQLRNVVKGVTEVGESSKQVFQVADQLKELQDILKNVLPPDSFQMQYAFSDGEIVDAAVFVKGKVIPVDSKFSLENYNRFATAKDGAEKVQFEKFIFQAICN